MLVRSFVSDGRRQLREKQERKKQAKFSEGMKTNPSDKIRKKN